MNKRLRTALLLGSAIAACLFVWLFGRLPPVWLPQPSAEQYAGLGGIWRLMGFALFFILLAPVWLPAAVPQRLERIAAAVQIVCGVVLLAAAFGLLVLMTAVGTPSFFWGSAAVVSAVVGVLHIQRARLQGPRHAA